MKLIKINTDHYIIVDENAEIKEGDWIYNAEREPSILKCVGKGSLRGWQKITHSTQPLECDKMWTPVGGKQWMCNTMLCCGKILNPKTKPISLQEVKELIGEVDVEKKAEEWFLINQYNQQDMIHSHRIPEYITTKNLWVSGYNQALEYNKDKKYTEEDLRKAIAMGYDWCHQKHIPDDWMIDNFIQHLKQTTQWDVEFDLQGKLKLKK